MPQSSTSPQTLVVVYAVDSGPLNTLIDVAHKLLSPKTYPCNLCALTYGAISEKRQWTAFLRELPIPSEFLHRDEFAKRYGAKAGTLPAVYVRQPAGLEPLISSEEIDKATTLEAFIALVRERVSPLR